MIFILEDDILKIQDKEKKQNSGSINYYQADVTFNEKWEGLTKYAIITKENSTKGIERAIINNKLYIDQELNGIYTIGFVGYTVEENTKNYQISTNLKKIAFGKGAGEIEVEEHELLTPSEWEIYIAQIQEMLENAGGGSGGGISEETDPTVPQHVKNITEENIKNWNNVDDLENVLQDILEAIQSGISASMIIEEIEQLIVSYFENKTVEEVEQ